MPSINITADAAQGVSELLKYNTALDAVTDRIDKLNSVQAQFNRSGQLTGATVKSQTGAFETLTQTINKAGVVTASYYEKNEAAARKAADAAKKRADDEQKRLEAQGNAFSNIANRIGRTLTSSITTSIFGFIKGEINDSIAAAKDFQVQLSLIRTISQGKEQQSFFKTGQDVRSVSDATGFGVKDVGKAFYDATSNQVAKGADTADFVKKAADFARTTGSTLPDSVNLLSTAINSFGKSAGDTERIAAVFFKTIDEGRVVASEMANTLGRIYPLADQVGVSMEEVNAAFAITTQKGVKTNDSITLLSNLLIKLEKPTAQTQEFFKSLGVSSGEAAIQLYGFTGVIQKMVDAVNSGQVPVSAFFDEIRGRKQFAVFQQSIGQIDEFTKKLQNTGQVVSEYRAAINIRGESAGDQLGKELNKLGNVFKVDLGQGILENLNAINKWAGGVDGVRNKVGDFSTILQGASIVLGGFVAISTVAALNNLRLAGSFDKVGKAAAAGSKAIIPLLALYASYQAIKAVRGDGIEETFIGGDKAATESTFDAIDRLKKARFDAAQTGTGPLSGLDQQKQNIESSYKGILTVIAQANIANNKFLDDAKKKSQETADQVKIAFGNFTDNVKKGISDLKKGIADANEEIKRSKKSIEQFADSNKEALFNFRSKYANDDLGGQKILLTQQRLAELEKRSREEFAKGTEEGNQEGRKLFEQRQAEIVKLAELRAAQGEKQFKADLEQHPERHDYPGGNIYLVSDEEVARQLAELTKERELYENKIIEAKQKQIAQSEKQVQSENRRLETLEQAIKKYDAITATGKDGETISADFKDKNGKFDRDKFNAKIAESETAIRGSVGGDTNQRFQLELLFSQRRVALNKEAAALERQENFKTAEAQVQSQKEKATKSVDDIKKERETLIAEQDRYIAEGSRKRDTFIAFGNSLGAGGKISDKDNARIKKASDEYNAAFEDLRDNRVKTPNGLSVLDPAKIEKTNDAAKKLLNTIEAIRDESAARAGNYNTPGDAFKTLSNRQIDFSNPGNAIGSLFGTTAGNTSDLTINSADGSRRATIGEARDSFDQLTQEGVERSAKLRANAYAEQQGNTEQNKAIQSQLDQLKKDFPEFAGSALKSTQDVNNGFKDLASGGLEDLRKKLAEIKALGPLNATPDKDGGQGKGRTGYLGDDGSNGVAYAATGGIVGQFPGQPRGVDQYPIWAAAGERIISAETSAMYAPMLDAIMQRRAPRYMAEGGIVGRSGTTNIGDINISVNGATTNTETARVVGNRLERQLRQNNIRLERRQ